MLDTLETYLADACTPEVTDQIRQAHDIFDAFGLDTYGSSFEEILMMNDEADAGQTLTDILNLTLEIQVSLLNQHGVRMTEETKMQMHTDVLQALKDIPNREDLHDLIQLAKRPGFSNERFAEIVHHVSHHTVEDVLVHLDFVSESLLDRIAEVSEEQQHNGVDALEHLFKETRMEQFKTYLGFVGEANFQLNDLIHQGVDAGFPVALYLNLLRTHLNDQTPDVIAMNLVGAAYLSEDAYQAPEAVLADYLETLLGDPELIVQVSVKIRELIVRFTQHAQA